MIRLTLAIIFAILTAGAIDGNSSTALCITLATASLLFSLWFLISKFFEPCTQR
jgi:hypothetical protein